MEVHEAHSTGNLHTGYYSASCADLKLENCHSVGDNVGLELKRAMLLL